MLRIVLIACGIAVALAAPAKENGNGATHKPRTTAKPNVCKWLDKEFQKDEQIEYDPFVYQCKIDADGWGSVEPVGCRGSDDGALHKTDERYKDGRFLKKCVITPGNNAAGTIREDLVACIAKDGSEKAIGESWVEAEATDGTGRHVTVKCKGDSTYLSFGPA